MMRPAPVVQEIAGAVRYVPVEVITEREPDAKVGRIEGITKPAVAPDYVARAEGGAELDVEDFFALPRAIERGDSTLPEPKLLARSVRTKSGFLFGKEQVTIVGVLSNGTLEERRYSAHAGWQFRTDGDSLVFQHPRFPIKKAVELGLVLGIGVLIGQIVF
jgi:hypothetical protein